MLDPHVWWPVFPMLLLMVVVCLTWAMVSVVRNSKETVTIWFQAGALVCYLLAAGTAIASEQGAVHANTHRPFSILTQVAIATVLARNWNKGDRTLLALNIGAWAAILLDTAFHFLMSR